MKRLYPLFIVLLISHISHAQSPPDNETTKKEAIKKIYTSVALTPEFPGGMEAFGNYVSKNLAYPEVARLIGINGKIYVSFVVDKDGKVIDVIPKNCIGAGCEAEAVKVIEMSPHWRPGIQNGKPVGERYTVPISFTVDKGKVTLKTLRKSGFGFVFNMKGTLYTIDEAEAILGSSFMSEDVQIADPFYNYNKIQKFDIPSKKGIYLIVMKSK